MNIKSLKDAFFPFSLRRQMSMADLAVSGLRFGGIGVALTSVLVAVDVVFNTDKTQQNFLLYTSMAAAFALNNTLDRRRLDRRDRVQAVPPQSPQ